MKNPNQRTLIIAATQLQKLDIMAAYDGLNRSQEINRVIDFMFELKKLELPQSQKDE